MTLGYTLCVLTLVISTMAQFISLDPTSLKLDLESRIKEASEALAKAPPSSYKESIDSLVKQAEAVIPELEKEKGNGWTEGAGCDSSRCFELLAKANDIKDEIVKKLNPEKVQNETEEKVNITEVPTSR